MPVGPVGFVGSAFAAATDTVVIPVGLTIPQSDPTGGATLIVVTLITDDASTFPGQIASVVDDGATDPLYGDCLIASGLNSYVEAPVGLSVASGNLGLAGSMFGLILNPLDATNSLTVTAGATYDFLFAFAFAYSGANCDTSALTGGPFADASFMFSGGLGSAPNPLGAVTCGATAPNLNWISTPGVDITNPVGCTGPTDWTWDTGSYAFYWNFFVNAFGGTTGAWTWTDFDIATQQEWDDFSTGIGSDTFSMVYAEQSITAPQSGIDVSGSWASTGEFGTNGAGAILLEGPGPTCPAPAPGNYPVFEHHFRAGD